MMGLCVTHADNNPFSVYAGNVRNVEIMTYAPFVTTGTNITYAIASIE